MWKLRHSIAGVAAVAAIVIAATPVAATAVASGQRFLGQGSQVAVIEPAYDGGTGGPAYLFTPGRARTPSTGGPVAPLYIVVYPSTYPGWTLNCMGVPGNCDHDSLIAGAATAVMPSVYGTDPAAVPGHDHLIGRASSDGDFDVAWHVWVVLFTTASAANTHVTTMSELQTVLGSGDAISIDSGIVFHASLVPAALYARGTAG